MVRLISRRNFLRNTLAAIAMGREVFAADFQDPYPPAENAPEMEVGLGFDTRGISTPNPITKHSYKMPLPLACTGWKDKKTDKRQKDGKPQIDEYTGRKREKFRSDRPFFYGMFFEDEKLVGKRFEVIVRGSDNRIIDFHAGSLGYKKVNDKLIRTKECPLKKMDLAGVAQIKESSGPYSITCYVAGYKAGERNFGIIEVPGVKGTPPKMPNTAGLMLDARVFKEQ